ncbi:hypothetical protein PINS_up013109 [Pythium insidiosum]|nr:hypothetical protein PINS_up013109 [Pythium insidiosum]
MRASRRPRRLVVHATAALFIATGSWLLGHAAAATPKPTPTPETTDKAETCDSGCRSIRCISSWWRDSETAALIGAAVLIFFATFLPRVLVRLVIFVLTKVPFIAQYVVRCRSLPTKRD